METKASSIYNCRECGSIPDIKKEGHYYCNECFKKINKNKK